MKNLLRILFFASCAITLNSQAIEPRVFPARTLPSRSVVVFVDMNGSPKELDALKRATSKMNIELMTIPSEKTIYEVGQLRDWLRFYEDRRNSLEKQKSALSEMELAEETMKLRTQEIDLKIQSLTDEQNQKSKLMGERINKNRFHPTQELEKLLSRLHETKRKISHFVISGHHSGGFYGEGMTTQTLRDSELFMLMRKHSEVTEKLYYLGLWGCGAVTPYQINQWRAGIPTLKMIAGFYGTAPHSAMPESGEVLESTVSSMIRLLNTTEPEKIKTLISRLKGVNSTLSAVYLNALDQKDYFYYNEMDSSRRIISTFGPLVVTDRCSTFMNQILPDHLNYLNNLLQGREVIPEDNAQSKLRFIYFDLMQFQDCTQSEPSVIKPQKAGLLRFYETGVKQNFLRVFDKEIQAAQEALLSVNMEDAMTHEIERIRLENKSKLEKTKEILIKLHKSLSAYDALTSDSATVNGIRFDELYPDYKQKFTELYQQMIPRLRKKLIKIEKFGHLDQLQSQYQSLKPGLKQKAQKYIDLANEIKAEIISLNTTVVGHRSSIQAQERIIQQIESMTDKHYELQAQENLKWVSDLLKLDLKTELMSSRSQQFKNKFPMLKDERFITLMKDKQSAFRKFLNLRERFLIHLDTDCMDMLEWHDASGPMPTIRCTL